MSYPNGQFPDSALAAIPGGRLDKEAAAAWNAPGGPAENGCRPLGPNSSYRTLETQKEYWAAYQAGTGNLAAYPGTSNHGLGRAVDLADPSMREWIDEHGHAFGWAKVEAPSEWWHVNYIGGYTGKPQFVALRRGDHGERVKRLQKLLRHAGGVLPKRKPYRYWPAGLRFTGKFGRITERRVKRFQRDHKLEPDGVVGEKTWATLRRLGRKDA